MKVFTTLSMTLALVIGLLFFTPQSGIASQPDVNCYGFDGSTYFECLAGEIKICTSIIVGGEPFQCSGTKRAIISPHDPE